MNASNQLIALYRATLSLTTNQSVADKLSVKQPTVSMWLNDKSHPDAESIEKMCTAIGEPLRKWLPLIEAERARTPAARKVWLRLAQAAASFAALALIMKGHNGHAIETAFLMPTCIHYAKCSIRPYDHPRRFPN